MAKRLDATVDIHKIEPINILEAYQPTVAQYGPSNSWVLALLLTMSPHLCESCRQHLH